MRGRSGIGTGRGQGRGQATAFGGNGGIRAWRAPGSGIWGISGIWGGAGPGNVLGNGEQMEQEIFGGILLEFWELDEPKPWGMGAGKLLGIPVGFVCPEKDLGKFYPKEKSGFGAGNGSGLSQESSVCPVGGILGGKRLECGLEAALCVLL